MWLSKKFMYAYACTHVQKLHRCIITGIAIATYNKQIMLLGESKLYFCTNFRIKLLNNIMF